MNRTINTFTFLILILFAMLPGCKESRKIQTSPPEDLPPVKVSIHHVEAKSVADQVEIMGSIQAAKSSIISPRISGNIISINVIPGSQVKKGDILVEINAGEISAKLLQAKAELDKAERNLQREKKLFAQRATTSEAVKALEDLHKIAAASFKEAQIMLSYTTIKAPFDGQITKKLVDVGELATPEKPLLHLEDEKNLQVTTDVPETIANNVSLGMKMQVTIPSTQLAIVGEVSEIAPASDPLTRTVPIKLNITKSPTLKSGQFARVTLPGTQVRTIIVPQDALHPTGQLDRVFVVSEGKARLRLVRTGKKYPQGIETLSGVSPGDKLILAGGDTVRDGQPVRIQ